MVLYGVLWESKDGIAEGVLEAFGKSGGVDGGRHSFVGGRGGGRGRFNKVISVNELKEGGERGWGKFGLFKRCWQRWILGI